MLRCVFGKEYGKREILLKIDIDFEKLQELILQNLLWAAENCYTYFGDQSDAMREMDDEIAADGESEKEKSSSILRGSGQHKI